jgi:hypothetical protein
MYKTKVDMHGNILIQYGSGEAEPTHNSVDADGFTWLEADQAMDIIMNYWTGSAWDTKPTRPNAWSVWVDNMWVDNAAARTNLQGDIQISMKVARSGLLYSSDWTQLSDAPISDSKREEWVIYRQALRDVPENNVGVTDIADIVWPTAPN